MVQFYRRVKKSTSNWKIAAYRQRDEVVDMEPPWNRNRSVRNLHLSNAPIRHDDRLNVNVNGSDKYPVDRRQFD